MTQLPSGGLEHIYGSVNIFPHALAPSKHNEPFSPFLLILQLRHCSIGAAI